MSRELNDPAAIRNVETHFTAAFHRSVLARYKSSLDLYDVDEDDCGGRLRRTELADPDQPRDEQYFELRYGFRHLADGRICVVAWLPDWDKLPERERNAWAIDAIHGGSFAVDDPTYDRWKGRILRGEWNDAGPVEQLRDELRKTRAITLAAGLPPLFKAESNVLLHYPIAENSTELLASVIELHRLAVEGLDLGAVRALAAAVGTAPPADPNSRSLAWLKSVLPDALVPLVHAPLNDLNGLRNQIHRVPAPASTSLPAFDQFLARANATVAAVSTLAEFLRQRLGIDVEAAVRRMELLESPMTTKIVPLPFTHAGTDNLACTVGKTIARVEIGAAKDFDFAFSRDGIAIHFTDGSSLVIAPMPNVGNWKDKVQGFSESELDVSLDATFIPSGKSLDES